MAFVEESVVLPMELDAALTACVRALTAAGCKNVRRLDGDR